MFNRDREREIKTARVKKHIDRKREKDREMERVNFIIILIL